jgi:hypothetical protein
MVGKLREISLQNVKSRGYARYPLPGANQRHVLINNNINTCSSDFFSVFAVGNVSVSFALPTSAFCVLASLSISESNFLVVSVSPSNLAFLISLSFEVSRARLRSGVAPAASVVPVSSSDDLRFFVFFPLSTTRNKVRK